MARQLFFIIFLGSNLVSNFAQFRSGSSDLIRLTDMKLYGREDSIFLFNIDNADTYLYSVSGDKSKINFQWSIYDSLAKDFTIIKSEFTDSSTFKPNSLATQYKLKRTAVDWSDSATCWVFENDFYLQVLNCDYKADTGWVFRDAVIRCGEITSVDVAYKPKSMFYYNPDSLVLLPVITKASNNGMIWSCSKTGVIAADGNQLSRNIIDPHWEDSYYIIQVTDNAGLMRKDSIFYKSIEPHAEFVADYIPPGDTTGYPNKDEQYYAIYEDYENISAPAIYKYKNLSKSSTSYTWDFGDSVRNTVIDTTFNKDYYYPGTYAPYLVAHREIKGRYKACTDTFRLEPVIDIESPSLAVNNVLSTGASDDKYRYFRFRNDVSIGYFEIVIYNRNGHKVYNYSGAYRDWLGWDGTDKDSESYVTTGVYYYVIKKIEPLHNFDPEIATEDINKEYSDKAKNDLYRGFIHVYTN